MQSTNPVDAVDGLNKTIRDYESIFDTAPLIIIHKDKNNHYVNVSSAFVNFVGVPKEEIIGKTPFDFIRDHQIAEKSWADDQEVMRTGKSVVNELARWAGFGNHKEIWVLYSKVPLYDTDGCITGTISYVVDVDERIKSEIAKKESEDKFRNVFDNSMVAKSITYIDGSMEANPAFYQMLGYTKEEHSQMNWRDITHPDDIELSQKYIEQQLCGNMDSVRFTKRYIKKDRSIVWVDLHSVLQKNEAGNPLYYITTVLDITERKLSEERLLAEKSRINSILAGIADTFYSLDFNWRFTVVNPAAENAPFGRPAKELLGKIIWDLYPHLVGSDIHRHYLDALKNKTLEHYEAQSPLNGRWYDVFMQGWTNGVDVYMRDITERKLAEEQLRDSRNRLDFACKSAQIGVWDWDIVNNTMLWDDQMFRLYGITEKPENYGVEIWKNGLHPEDIAYAWDACQATLRGEKKYDIEFRVQHPDGQICYIKADGIVVRDEDGKALRMIGINHDITERKRAEVELQTSEAKFRAVAELSPMAIYSSRGSDQKARYINEAFYKIFGFSREDVPTVGHWWIQAFPDEKYRQQVIDQWTYNLEQAAKNNTDVAALECVCTCKDGSEKSIVWVGKTLDDEFWAFGYDMTEKHKLLNNMQRIDKLDSLGVLAGGIAHDFNNLLGGIFGYIDMAREHCGADKTVAKYLDKALTVFGRAKDLTQQLLTFSKGGAPKRKTGYLGTLVRENAAFVLSGTNVNCDFSISPNLWLCDFDENQIGQVIDNMVINAQQAMPMGGTIIISVNNVSLKNSENSILKGGNYIRISIKDSGIGIPHDLLTRIFDPFFTTKQKGNGLGLATCYSIIQKHDGCIDVESVAGKGSTFHVFLPASQKDILPEAPLSATQHRGKGSIIIMDDEDFMREIVRDMLLTMGYTPIEAKNGDEALQLCTEAIKKGDPVSGALFDLTIPGGMGGKETIVKFREKFPGIPVFASSGFSEDPVMAKPMEFGFTDSIRKPFQKGALAELLNKNMP